MKTILTIFTVLFISQVSFACETQDKEFSRMLNNGNYSIQGPLTIQWLEHEYLFEIRETKEMVPFGYVNGEWLKLKSMFQAGDSFYVVQYEDENYYSEQHVLVRDGCIIGSLLGEIT